MTNEDDEIDGGDAGENGKQGKNVPGFGDGIDGAGGLVENDARRVSANGAPSRMARTETPSGPPLPSRSCTPIRREIPSRPSVGFAEVIAHSVIQLPVKHESHF